MTDEQRQVEEFHRTFEILTLRTPTAPDDATRLLRERLIEEEFAELREAMTTGDIPSIAKELADLLYVVYGTAVSCGIDMETVFREVHRSNMSKVGGYKRADGKWVKPPTYSKAALKPILLEQGWQGERPEVGPEKAAVFDGDSDDRTARMMTES
jgi:predicted HAD superfamily Cof-like phosphohydrolase